MLKSNMWGSNLISKNVWPISPFFLVIALTIALGVGILLGLLKFPIELAVSGAIVFATLLILRQNELAIGAVVAVGIYVDWYIGLVFVALSMSLVLLLAFYFFQSPQFPWVKPHGTWLWLLFLVLALFPAIRGITLLDGTIYYFTIIFSPFIVFWLGMILARDVKSVRYLLNILAILATLIAIHAIIESATGIFLFKTSHYDAQLADSLDFQLSKTDLHRVESFLRNPDSAGGFFAVMVLIPFGLFAESSTLLKKFLYLIEIFLMLIGLLFSYSLGGWIAVLVGVGSFMVLVGRNRYRLLLLQSFLAAAAIIIVFFPVQVAALLQHMSDPNEILLRNSVWQTAIKVIQAFPLTGIGLGHNVYVVRAEPYRVYGQYTLVIHPHDSFLEFAALGGIPVLVVFVALLSMALWKALWNWRLSDKHTRSLLAGGIASVFALNFYCLSNAGWTLAPLALIGWLVLGITSSPLFLDSHTSETVNEHSEER